MIENVYDIPSAVVPENFDGNLFDLCVVLLRYIDQV